MLAKEKEWTRARVTGRIWVVVAVVVLAVHNWLADLTGIPPYLVVSLAIGAIAGNLISEIWIYRKPKERPSDDTIARVDRQNIPTMLVSTIATWTMLGAFAAATMLTLPDWLFWTLIFLGALSLLVALALLPRLINHMRLSRVAPELYDERSQENFAKAYQQAFNVMFQVSFLGGLALMWEVIVLPAGLAVMGVGLVGIMSLTLLWCWHEWRDGR